MFVRVQKTDRFRIGIKIIIQIRKCAHEALTALQNGSPDEFESLLDSLPPTTAETCRYLLEATFSVYVLPLNKKVHLVNDGFTLGLTHVLDHGQDRE